MTPAETFLKWLSVREEHGTASDFLLLALEKQPEETIRAIEFAWLNDPKARDAIETLGKLLAEIPPR